MRTLQAVGPLNQALHGNQLRPTGSFLGNFLKFRICFTRDLPISATVILPLPMGKILQRQRASGNVSHRLQRGLGGLLFLGADLACKSVTLDKTPFQNYFHILSFLYIL